MQAPLTKERVGKLQLRKRVTAGCDPGSRNMGFGLARLNGLVRLTRNDGTVVKEGVPDVEVLYLGRWNLKQGQVLTHDADWNPMSVQLDGFTGACTEDMTEWRRALVKCIQRVQPLFVRDEHGDLPVLVTENQCDHIKVNKNTGRPDTHRAEMYRLADQVKTIVDLEDQTRELGRRENRFAQGKYLVPHDGSLDEGKGSHDPLKLRSIEVAFELCEELGLEGPLKFLTELKRRGEKIDDICDALLLAVQDQLDCMSAEARELIREARALIKCVPDRPTAKRQRKALLKPLSEKEIKERTEQGLPLCDPIPEPKKPKRAAAAKPRAKAAPKPRATKATTTTTKKRGRKVVVEEELDVMLTDTNKDSDDTTAEEDVIEVNVLRKRPRYTDSDVGEPVLLSDVPLVEPCGGSLVIEDDDDELTV